MIKNLKLKIFKNIEISGLIFLLLFTGISTGYFNYEKNLNKETYNNVIGNIYFKKTINHIIENLEPKYKKIKHKINTGETFDKILESYSVSNKEN